MTIRDDVRNAFDREQSELGEVRDARYRLVRQAMVEGHAAPARGWQWAAGVAAMLIAAIVVTTFALVRANSHATFPAATPSPRAQASPTPLSSDLNVPDSTAILVYTDPVNANQVDGSTWDGRTRGKMSNLIVGVPNPNANLFGDASKITDRNGNHVASGSFGVKGAWLAKWADDGTHVCYTTPFSTFGPPGVPTSLVIASVGGPPRVVAAVGTLYEQTTVRVAACSVVADRAVVVQSGGQGVGVSSFWVVQLSTGRTLWSGGAGAWITSSHDGRYVALTDFNGNTTIYGADGVKSGYVPDMVLDFSWDGTLAVVAAGVGDPPSIVDWRASTTIWTAPPSLKYEDAFAEPGGSRIAIAVANPAYSFTSGLGAPLDLFVVGADGTVVIEMKHIGPINQ